ncbi:MAG: methyl-accepting chemotaxis protein [Acidimicrobiales bacterium]
MVRLFRKAATWLVVVLGFQLIGAGLLSWQSISSKQAVSRFTATDLKMAGALRHLGEYYWKYDDDLNNYAFAVLSGPPSSVASWKSASQGDAATIHASLETISRLAVPGSPIALTAQRIARDVAGYDINANRVYALAAQGKSHQAFDQQLNGNGAVSNDLTNQLPALSKEVDSLQSQTVGGVGAKQTTLLVISIVVSLVGVGLIILLGVGFRSLVIRPLEAITRFFDFLLNGGNERPGIDAERDDEFGDLARVASIFVDTVTGVVGATDRVSREVEKLDHASEKINLSATESYESTSHVNESVEKVVTNINSVVISTGELRTAIREIADNASSAATVAREAATFADGVNAEVLTLGSSVREIESVISIINSIAEQTNLLALNAAIEAARAGDAGKGFAVVAGEVKELANETQKATKDIRARIDTMVAESNATITSVEKVQSFITQISDLQSSIASAVEEQSVTTDEIGRMTEIATDSANAIAHSTGALVTASDHTLESAKVSQDASRLVDRAADELRALTARFVGLHQVTGGSQKDRFRTERATDAAPQPVTVG